MAIGMELLLNLAWFLVALAMWVVWLRAAGRNAAERRLQLIALAVMIFVLLPAISMTDDLLAAQNPAETDSCLRRDHEISSAHSVFPATAAPPLESFAGLDLHSHRLAAPGRVAAPAVKSPALSSFQSRPPPEA